jgi:hypothetical protein
MCIKEGQREVFASVGECPLFQKQKTVMGKSKWLLPKKTLTRSINIYTHPVRFKWV